MGKERKPEDFNHDPDSVVCETPETFLDVDGVAAEDLGDDIAVMRMAEDASIVAKWATLKEKMPGAIAHLRSSRGSNDFRYIRYSDIEFALKRALAEAGQDKKSYRIFLAS